MIRLRTTLLLLAITALLLSGAPVFAATGDPGLPSWMTAPASAALGTPAPIELVFPPPNDFILCSCELCRAYPDVICQISPSGYSILCADYSRLNCKSGPVS